MKYGTFKYSQSSYGALYSRVYTSFVLKWNLFTRVFTTSILKWNLLARVYAQIRLKWNLWVRLYKNFYLSWRLLSNGGIWKQVEKTSGEAWNKISTSNLLNWDKVSKTTGISWDKVSGAQLIDWNLPTVDEKYFTLNHKYGALKFGQFTYGDKEILNSTWNKVEEPNY